jgi:hypothetical protein
MRPLRRSSCTWEDNIKMDLRKAELEDACWIHLFQDRDQWRALDNTFIYVRVTQKAENFLKSWATVRFCSVESLLMRLFLHKSVPWWLLKRKCAERNWKEINEFLSRITLWIVFAREVYIQAKQFTDVSSVAECCAVYCTNPVISLSVRFLATVLNFLRDPTRYLHSMAYSLSTAWNSVFTFAVVWSDSSFSLCDLRNPCYSLHVNGVFVLQHCSKCKASDCSVCALAARSHVQCLGPHCFWWSADAPCHLPDLNSFAFLYRHSDSSQICNDLEPTAVDTNHCCNQT